MDNELIHIRINLRFHSICYCLILVFLICFDLILDLRKDSSTYKKHIEIEIGPECEYQGLFIPAGCAHGYLTLEPNSTLIYFMDKVYSPDNSQGIRWNDSKLSINLPRKPNLVSQQDLQWPELET